MDLDVLPFFGNCLLLSAIEFVEMVERKQKKCNNTHTSGFHLYRLSSTTKGKKMDTKIWKGIEQDSQPLELLVQLGFPQISQDDLSLAKQLTDVRYHIEHDECILAHQKYTIAQTLLEPTL